MYRIRSEGPKSTWDTTLSGRQGTGNESLACTRVLHGGYSRGFNISIQTACTVDQSEYNFYWDLCFWKLPGWLQQSKPDRSGDESKAGHLQQMSRGPRSQAS